MYPYILTPQSITLFADRVYSMAHDHPNFPLVTQAIQNGAWEQALDALYPLAPLKRFFSTCELVHIENDTLYINAQPASSYVTHKALRMARDGFDPTPLLNFIERLQDNVATEVIAQLYPFMEHNALPITPEGYFLAYKRVNADYTDVYTGTIANHVGANVSMPRCYVDADPERTCSQGLHFAGKSYLDHFSGERIMVLKIDPADVVAIPTDYNRAKGRCCAYTVVAELPLDQVPQHTWNEVETGADNQQDNAARATPVTYPVHYDYA